MSLDRLLKPVLPQLPMIRPDDEVEMLHEMPVETLYLALKVADGETSLWLLENAQPNQIQGIIDLDCWDGSEFSPERALLFFENIALLEPRKLFEYMKELDPEFVVRSLMELCDVEDYDPQNPPNIPEDQIILSPDNKYALILKEGLRQHREALYLWLNKLSAASLDLMRRHLESCKWEQKTDLEEFAFQIKKGRLEDLGFVDYHEAIQIYSTGRASDVKEKLLKDPLEKNQKLKIRSFDPEADRTDVADIELWLPKPIKGAILGAGFLADCLSRVEPQELKEVILQEILRSVNTALSADRALHQDLETIRNTAERARRYIDLGLAYLSDGNKERGALLLEIQPLLQIHRLGWLCVQDLCAGARALLQKSPADFYSDLDTQFLTSLNGRHPELAEKLLKDLGSSGSITDLVNLIKAGQRLAQLSAYQRFFTEDLGKTMAWESNPRRTGESSLARLLTGLFRQSTHANAGTAFDVRPISESEWLDIVASFDEGILQKSIELIVNRAPETLRDFLHKRVMEGLQELQQLVKTYSKKRPDKRFTRILSLE